MVAVVSVRQSVLILFVDVLRMTLEILTHLKGSLKVIVILRHKRPIWTGLIKVEAEHNFIKL